MIEWICIVFPDGTTELQFWDGIDYCYDANEQQCCFCAPLPKPRKWKAFSYQHVIYPFSHCPTEQTCAIIFLSNFWKVSPLLNAYASSRLMRSECSRNPDVARRQRWILVSLEATTYGQNDPRPANYFNRKIAGTTWSASLISKSLELQICLGSFWSNFSPNSLQARSQTTTRKSRLYELISITRTEQTFHKNFREVHTSID